MAFNFGLNTGFGTGFTGYNTGYQTSSIDYSRLNGYTDSIMTQLSLMSGSPLSQISITNSVPTWFNNIASCFTVDPLVTGSNPFANPFGSVASLMQQYAPQNPAAPSTPAAQQTPEEKAAEEKKKAEEKAKTEKAQKEANEICEKLFVAMKGAGTDEKAVEAALARITEDNILEVMETYYQQYSESMDGETLIGSIQDDFSFGAEKRIINTLKEKLAARASSMGLDTEAKSFRAKVTAENDGFWGNMGADDEIVDGAFTTLLSAMITKRAQG